MDISDIANKLGLSDKKLRIRKAAGFRRLCDVKFNPSIIGVSKICKAVVCLEIASSRLQVSFNRELREAAIKLSGMSARAYTRSYDALQNGVRLKEFQKYKERFLASLPASRRANADLTRPVFTAAAFFICQKTK